MNGISINADFVKIINNDFCFKRYERRGCSYRYFFDVNTNTHLVTGRQFLLDFNDIAGLKLYFNMFLTKT